MPEPALGSGYVAIRRGNYIKTLSSYSLRQTVAAF